MTKQLAINTTLFYDEKIIT